MLFTAFAVAHTAYDGHFTDFLGVANALRQTIGYAAGAMAAIILVDASIIGACAVTLASAYAFGDTFEIRHSLHRKASEAKAFYGIYAAQVVAAAAIVLIPRAPLGTITEYVQVLAGVLLPSASVFLLLLCNDTAVLGPWVNRTWLNVVTVVIIGVLVVLSLVLTVNVLFPTLDVPALTLRLFIALAAALGCGGGATLVARNRRMARGGPSDRRAEARDLDRNTWRMPPLALVERPVKTRLRSISLLTLRLYLVAAVVLVAVKLVTTIS
jgi:hypothetical protein